MKDFKKIRKSLDSAYQKIVKWKKNGKKTMYKSQEEKLEKH